MINTVIPFLYAYGLHKADEALCERATRFLESLKAEDNHTIRHWSGAGLPVSTAADSQALLQLRKSIAIRKTVCAVALGLSICGKNKLAYFCIAFGFCIIFAPD